MMLEILNNHNVLLGIGIVASIITYIRKILRK